MKTLLCLFAVATGFLILNAAPRPRVAVQQQCHCPKVLGRVTLDQGVGTVYHPGIAATDLVVFSVFSPDSLAKGHRVSVSQLDTGTLSFWVTGDEGVPTNEEPEVHYAVYSAP
jgi:hypothetical protein